MSTFDYLLIAVLIFLVIAFIVYVLLEVRKAGKLGLKRKTFKEVLSDFYQLFLYSPTKNKVNNQLGAVVRALAEKGTRSLYDIPVFLVIGTKQSGKSSFIKKSGLQFPLGLPANKHDDLCVVWVTNNGIYIEVREALKNSDNKNNNLIDSINLVLSALAKHRRRRLLDGVIVTVDYEWLVENYEEKEKNAEEAPPEDQNQTFGNLMKSWLLTISHKAQLELPLYWVITKIDRMSGMPLLVSYLDKPMRKQIFGWTNEPSSEVRDIDSVLNTATDVITTRLEFLRDVIFASEYVEIDQNNFILIAVQIKAAMAYLKDALYNKYSSELLYDEEFFIRGLYFTYGQFDEAQSILQEVYFSYDLLSLLIARDLAFANKVIRYSSTEVFFKNITLYLFMIFLTVCILLGEESVRDKVKVLDPPMTNITTDLNSAIHLESTEDLASVSYWEKIYMTRSHYNWNIMSAWVPVSWLSPMALSLPSVMEKLSTIAIMRVFYNSLNAQIDTVVSTQTKNNIPINASNLDQFVKYTALTGAVNNSVKIMQMIDLYNELGSSTSESNFNALVDYLYPKNAKDRPKYDPKLIAEINLLKEKNLFTPFDKIDLRVKLSGKLFNLFESEGTTLVTEWPLTQAINQVGNILQGASAQKDMREISILQDNLLSIISISNLVGDKKTGLFSRDVMINFAIGTYQSLMQKAQATKLLDTEQISTLDKKYVQPFSDIVNKNLTARLPIVDRVYLLNTTTEQYRLSPSISSLSAAAAFIISFNFGVVDVPLDSKKYNLIASGKFKINPLKFQQVVKLVNQSDLFYKKKTLLKDPAEINYIEILSHQVIDTEAMRLLLDAVEPLDPSGEEMGAASQLALQSGDIVKFRTLLSSLLKNSLTSGLVYTNKTLVSIIVALVRSTLTLAKEKLADYHLYVPDDLDFSNTSTPLAFQAYHVDSDAELQAYLVDQKTLVSDTLANYVTPSLNLLVSAPEAKTNFTAEDINLYNFWNNTAKTLAAYKKAKTPANSLVKLQNFIGKEMNTVNMFNCDDVKPLGTTQDDFFIEKLAYLRNLIRSTCTKQSEVVAKTEYDNLRDGFNAYLQGRFPFVSQKDAFKAKDVPYDTLVNFYTTYEAAINQIIKQYSRKGASPSDKFRLLQVKRLQSALNFLLVNVKDVNATPEYYIQFAYRVNRINEIAANQILNWRLSSDNGALDKDSKVKRILWQYGNGIALELDWADDSPQLPKELAEPDLTIDGNVVTFSFDDSWSLLRFIATHRVPMNPPKGKFSALLSFTVNKRHNPEEGIYSLAPKTDITVVYAGITLLHTKTMKPLVI